MTPLRRREEAVNTCFADLLLDLGIAAEAETIQRKGRSRPDVLFSLGGLRVIIEGKFADLPNAKEIVQQDAQSRLNCGLCHIAIAVVYPEALRSANQSDLRWQLTAARLPVLVLSEFEETGWSEATPQEILEIVRRVHEALIRDDVVARAAEKLSERIKSIAEMWLADAATCERLASYLEIRPKAKESGIEREQRHSTAAQVASLVLANALIFQEQLATSGGDARVLPLGKINEAHLLDELKSHWNWIWSNINYVPIFQLGEKILNEVPASAAATRYLKWLIADAREICTNQSALRHDLMGRIYHWLLYHAKYLGTYYTATSSATLLMKWVMSLPWARDFGDIRQLAQFKVADLACGTGTLLMAAAQALTDAFIVSRSQSEERLDKPAFNILHKTLMENVLYGYDVLLSAVHLTASTLGMLAPDVTYHRMNLFIMPMGVQGDQVRLGSLDFYGGHRISTQLALDDTQMEARQSSVRAERVVVATLPQLDLCVMNPPFVRSVGGNLLFGSMPDQRGAMQTALKRLVKTLSASTNAGLGSVFLAIADKYVVAGGRLAFILPSALATGESWASNRKLLADKYHVEAVFASHDPARPNFSENTDLAELMFIARKLEAAADNLSTTYINLWYNPPTIYDALDIANRTVRAGAERVVGQDGISVQGVSRKFGEMIRLPASRGKDQWSGVQFAQAWTLRCATSLQQGWLLAPGQTAVTLPLCPLSDLGALGPDRKRIHEGFKVSTTDWSPYPSFWNHDSKSVTTIQRKPNSWLTPWQASPRGADYGPRRLWPRAGNILLVERFRANSHRVLAIGISERVLGNTWWALNNTLTKEQEKTLLLWLNSTPAILMTLFKRVTTEGAWMQVKQPQWAKMPVLDVRQLEASVLTRLAAAYDAVCGKELLALAKLDRDPVRREIDDALSAALGLPDLAKLRELLAREPGLTGKGLSPKIA